MSAHTHTYHIGGSFFPSYARVISGDLSLAMLQETRARCVAGGLVPELVRMDAGKLPIASGALDGVHAGAAMHCWPRVPQVCIPQCPMSIA